MATLRGAFTAVREHGVAWADHVSTEMAYELMGRHPRGGTSYVLETSLSAYAVAAGQVA